MKTFQVKSILVAVDFSTIAHHAILHAERIGALTNARITLLHVVEPYGHSLGMDAGLARTGTALIREMQIRGSGMLQRMARTTMKGNDVHVRTMSAIGPIAATIRRKASETRSDLIIMGTHGTGGFVENVLGSNAYRVATLSRVPVLSVHKPVERNAYSQIVYPVRGNMRTMEKFVPVLTFARLFHSRVHIVGLHPPGGGHAEMKIHALCAQIKKRFADNGVETKTAFATGHDRANAIVRYVQAYSGSLVVISQDNDIRLVELFQGTFPKRILQKVLSPVLTVPGR